MNNEEKFDLFLQRKNTGSYMTLFNMACPLVFAGTKDIFEAMRMLCAHGMPGWKLIHVSPVDLRTEHRKSLLAKQYWG